MSPKGSAARAQTTWPAEAAEATPVVAPEGVETVKRRLLRLALDVHDGPMQNLAVIGFSLGDLRRRMSQIVPEEHQGKVDSGLAQIVEELGKVESELRSLIVALEDGVTESVPLREALESEVRAFRRRSSAEVELSFDRKARIQTDSQRIALQAVTRAALANVSKHARARNVLVHVRAGRATITLEIEDDGRGFDPTTPGKPGRFGLTGMRERIELLGGSFEVASRPGGPTRITATLATWRPPAHA